MYTNDTPRITSPYLTALLYILLIPIALAGGFWGGNYRLGCIAPAIAAAAAAFLAFPKTSSLLFKDSAVPVYLLLFIGPLLMFLAAWPWLRIFGRFFLDAALLCLLGLMRCEDRKGKPAYFLFGYYGSLLLCAVSAGVIICLSAGGLSDIFVPLLAVVVILIAQLDVMHGGLPAVSGLFAASRDSEYRVSGRWGTAAAIASLILTAFTFGYHVQMHYNNGDSVYSAVTVWVRFLLAGGSILALWKLFGAGHRVFVLGVTAVVTDSLYFYLLRTCGTEPLFTALFYAALFFTLAVLLLRLPIRRWAWPIPAAVTLLCFGVNVAGHYANYGWNGQLTSLFCKTGIGLLFSFTLFSVCFALRSSGTARTFSFARDGQSGHLALQLTESAVPEKSVTPLAAAAVCFVLFLAAALLLPLTVSLPETPDPDTAEVPLAEAVEPDNIYIMFGGSKTDGFMEPVGTELQLDAGGKIDTNGEPFTVVWSSSDETVAKVSDDGYVTLVGSGHCTITASVNSLSCSIDVWCQ